MAEELYPNREAAEYLHITAGTLSVWRSRNRYPIPFLRVGSKILYRKSDLDAFLAARLVKPPEKKQPRRRSRKVHP